MVDFIDINIEHSMQNHAQLSWLSLIHQTIAVQRVDFVA